MLKQIGAVLRKYRKKSQLTQSQVAEKLGNEGGHGYIGRIERGESPPKLEYIQRLLILYNKSEGEFFNDVTDKYVNKKPVDLKNR